MTTEISAIFSGLTSSFVDEWLSILALIFGGCCSNALTLEQLTYQHANIGRLLTFCQFLLITLYGLPKFVVLKPYPHLRPRQIPILPFLIQVVLFYWISLLNNAAFAYAIPMPVHIIFRSGGLVVNMVLNWVILRRRYNLLQITSVVLVTLGVALTTLSASNPKLKLDAATSHSTEPWRYATGVAILTLALVLSGFLGLVQDRTYTKYGGRAKDSGTVGAKPEQPQNQPAPWEESMFYLHFLSMPMFLLMKDELIEQIHTVYSGPKVDVIALVTSLRADNNWPLSVSILELIPECSRQIWIPVACFPLLLNTLTQLFCVSGVHQLTSRVSSLTVTLVLVVRKAVSLVISIMLFDRAGPALSRLQMWLGAMLVFSGTVGYSLGVQQKRPPQEKAKTD